MHMALVLCSICFLVDVVKKAEGGSCRLFLLFLLGIIQVCGLSP